MADAFPAWWEWELELSAHLLRRMVDRDFTEVDLRRMLDEASDVQPNIVPGRWSVSTEHGGAAWEVIVEPDDSTELLVVVTAFSCEP